MISKSHKGVPVLQIDNLHPSECGAPPTVDATAKFVSYFENGFGEQWVLVGDKASGKAAVYAGDCQWRKSIEVSIDLPYPRVTPKELGRRDQFDLGIEVVQRHLQRATVEGGESGIRDLHVLLRHRLLPQAEVGERAVAIQVNHEPICATRLRLSRLPRRPAR